MTTEIADRAIDYSFIEYRAFQQLPALNAKTKKKKQNLEENGNQKSILKLLKISVKKFFVQGTLKLKGISTN